DASSLTSDLCPLTSEQEVVVSIRDDGVGIPEDMLERIFDLFAQVDRSLSSASQWGLGIGLALVRTLVEMHGGSVRASSAGPNQGSEFTVRLPIVEAGSARDEAPGEDSPTAQIANPKSRRVL